MEDQPLKQFLALAQVPEELQHHQKEEELLLSARWGSLRTLTLAMPMLAMTTTMIRIMSLVSNQEISLQVERSRGWQFKTHQIGTAIIRETL